MLKLPKVPYTMDKDQAVAIPFRGINFSDRLSDGDIADSFGISMRRYPFVTNKRGRKYQNQEKLEGITHYDGRFVYVKEGALYYDQLELSGEEGGEVKSFATINSKVVMMPGKKYIEFAGGEPAVCDLEEEKRVSDVTFRANAIDVGYSALKSLPGGWFDADSKSFRQSSVGRVSCNTPMLMSGNVFEPICKIVSDNIGKTTEKLENGYRVSFEITAAEYNYINKYDLSSKKFIISKGVYVQIVKPISYELSEMFWDSGGASYYLILYVSDPINSSVSGVSIYVDGWLEDAPEYSFTEVLKVGDSVELASVSYHISEVTKYTITIQETTLESIIYGKLDLRFKIAGRPFIEYIAEGDILKFDGCYNVGPFEVANVEEHILTFAASAVITNEEIANVEDITIWKAGDESPFADFKEGDGVTVSGCGEALKDNNRTFVIDKIIGNTLYAAADIFKAGNETNKLTISRKVPELDFICEAENRLWGCNSSENTIYISALGDPTNMYAYEGLSTDSFATAVGSPGDFTGCCRYSSSVLFFKEDKIHKILGTCPADYTLYSYDVEGIQKGSERSAVVINEALYYKGTHGIYAYDGGIPTLISDCFGDKLFYDAVAGTDGVSYYVSMHDAENKWYLFAYNTQTGIWTLEDKGFRAKDAVRVGMDLYFLDNAGVLWKENAVEDVSESEWMIQFTPFYETIQGKKIYSRLLLRAELPKGSYMVVEIRCDGGRWMELGKIVGKSDGVVPVRIPVNRCDKFEIRLRGKGEFLLREMLREYYVSSEK